MEISVLTPKFTLVPASFFKPESARECLGAVTFLKEADEVKWTEVPQYDAVLVYCSTKDDRYSTEIDETVISEGAAEALPEMFFILRDLPSCREYNKILCTYRDGLLHMAIAQGGSLLLSNTYKAPDFTTAEYYIFLAMKSLQLNPEVSTICWRRAIGLDEEMSLYRYFKAVEVL